MRDNKSKGLVSVIVPVYNVEKYIDQCLRSLSEQTYKNVEIVIVYDHCEDHTLQKCQAWANKDKRMKLLINDSRSGVGMARNKGMHYSKGEYIAHVDSDDWIGTEFIEKLVNAIEETDSDYVGYSGALFLYDKTEKKRHWLPAGTYYTDEDIGMLLLCDAPAVWKRLYRRRWLFSNKLYYPDIFHYDDWAYNMATVLKANKVTLLKGGNNYYRIRSDSLTSETKVRDYSEALRFGIQETKRVGVYDKNIAYLMLNVLYHFQIQANLCKDDNVYGEVFSNIWSQFDSKITPINRDIEYILFGSFSSWWALMRGGISRDIDYYGFSSLISAMSTGEMITADASQEFRKKQVIKDISGKLYERMSSLSKRTVLYLDFQNERYDLIKNGNEYYTKSEAFNDAVDLYNKEYQIIKSGTDEFMNLWKKKCERFVCLLKKNSSLVSVVLLQERLSQHYGNLENKNEFDHSFDIRAVNDRISIMEEVFTEKCKKAGVDVKLIDFSTIDERLFFTDEEFEYGCEPHYLNNYVYGLMGKQLFIDRIETNIGL